MAESYNKKERAKKKLKKQREKQERREQKKLEGKSDVEFMYVDEFGNLTSTPPDPNKKREEIALEDIELGGAKREKSTESKYAKTGYVKFFNAEKGYGFIEDKDSRDDFFVHVDNALDDIRERDRVKFEVGKGPKGPIAINVQVIKPEPKKPKAKPAPKNEGPRNDAPRNEAPKKEAAPKEEPSKVEPPKDKG